MIYFLSKTKITFLAGLLTLVWVMLATTVLGQGFIERKGDFGLNPFFSYNFSPNPPGASPSLADLDGDGDLELVVVNVEGSVSYNINAGGLPGDESFIYYQSRSPFASLPDSYSAVNDSRIGSLAGVVPNTVVNPAFDSSVNLKFSFGDLDGDGDLDGVTGNEEGKILIFINTGSRNNPLFSLPGSAPIGPAGISYPGEGVSFVSLADFDGDRDLDLLMLTNTTFHYLRNTGTTTNAVFEEVTGSGNPFNGFAPDAGHGNPVVGDIDGDGDLDVALAGTSIAFYRNVGRTTAPVFVRINNAANPFNGITFSADDVPRIELGDMDNDNDLDLAGGVKSGKIRYFENGVHVYGQPTPASQTVCVGSPVSVTIGARGDGFYSNITQTTSLRYQWYRNTQTTATPVPGQTSATLSLTNVQPGDAGLYYVQVMGSARYTGEELSVFSDGLTLTVQSGIGITQQPPSTSVVLTGTNVSVPVSVSGAVTGYQWYRNGAIVTGQTSATLTLTSVTSAQAGSYSLVATSSCNSVTSSAFSLAVVSTALSVLHRDADYGNTGNNIIKPYLQLANAGGTAIPYGELTVRYWFTAEGQASPTNLAVYYAQLGAVNMKYVALSQPRQGAFGYVEYSFPGGGSVAANGNSGPIENGIQKTDGSNFNESDDYSYQANYQTYLPNARVTAYRNGTIIWGQEPTTVQSQTAVAVYSAAKDGTTTSQIQTRLELRNPGNVALAVGSLKLRYYFTSDNNQLANVYVDYAAMGAARVAVRVVKLPAPVNGADSYVELSFPGSTLQVNALSSLGVIDFRLVRSDNGLFNQSNDYSYAGNYGNVGLNNRVTVLLDNRLIFGTPPTGAPARLGATEPVAVLGVQVLGNPVVDDQAQIKITGVAGQAVSLRLVDLQGRAVHEQRIQQAAETESVSLPLGQSRGQLLLRVSTESQQQSVKLLRP